jgi:hypothetical protein
VSVLLNLLEELASENARLRQENQMLKDEINRLKGEQGKPEIKANIRKDGNISSEQERRSAEQLDTNELNKEGFNLDKGSFEKLKEQRLPVELLDQLESLNSKKYSSEKEFLKYLDFTRSLILHLLRTCFYQF